MDFWNESAKLESEENQKKVSDNTSDDTFENPRGRSTSSPKTAQRLHYEAQARVIEGRIGDLESIRQALGVSQRKMCQILLVDPSAWNRWTRADGKAPPHIYRALDWYLTLQEKFPGGEQALHTLPSRIMALQAELAKLRGEMEQLRQQQRLNPLTAIEADSGQVTDTDRSPTKRGLHPWQSGVKALIRILHRLGGLFR